MDRVELIERRSRYFRAVLSAKGLKTMAALAKRLDVSPSTLANIQRAKRSAGPDLIEKITRLAPEVEGSEFLSAKAEVVDIMIEPTAGVRLSIGKRLDQDYGGQLEKLGVVGELDDPNIEGIRRNFDALDEGDVFIYLSATTPPIEMGIYDTKLVPLKEAIANAMQRGAFLLYLTPTTEFLQSVGSFIDFPAQFARFKEKVLSLIPNIDGIQGQCSRRLLHIQTDENSLFVLPDFKWELFLSDKIDTPYKAVAGALVVSGLAATNPGPRIRIPLSDPSTKRVLVEIEKAVCIANSTLSDPVPLKIVERLRKSVDLATERTS